MRLTRSARKHGFSADDIRRVLAAPVRSVPQVTEAHGEVVLHIGLTPQRDLVEVVVAPGDPPVVLHAMRLRPANYALLAPGAPNPRPGSSATNTQSCPDGGRSDASSAGTVPASVASPVRGSNHQVRACSPASPDRSASNGAPSGL